MLSPGYVSACLPAASNRGRAQLVAHDVSQLVTVQRNFTGSVKIKYTLIDVTHQLIVQLDRILVRTELMVSLTLLKFV